MQLNLRHASLQGKIQIIPKNPLEIESILPNPLSVGHGTSTEVTVRVKFLQNDSVPNLIVNHSSEIQIQEVKLKDDYPSTIEMIGDLPKIQRNTAEDIKFNVTCAEDKEPHPFTHTLEIECPVFIVEDLEIDLSKRVVKR